MIDIEKCCVFVCDDNRKEVNQWIKKYYPYDFMDLNADFYLSLNTKIGLGYSNCTNGKVIVSIQEFDRLNILIL